jgi:hypothetical protein
MWNIVAGYKINIVLSLTFFLLLLLFLFPLEKFVGKILKKNIKKMQVFLVLELLGLVVIFASAKLVAVLSFPMVAFSLFVFLFGFLSDRKYIYLLALISLALTPVMLILKMDQVAEFFAQTCYLLLVLGVLKDIFYEKVFE